jgi:hypothetical protein
VQHAGKVAAHGGFARTHGTDEKDAGPAEHTGERIPTPDGGHKECGRPQAAAQPRTRSDQLMVTGKNTPVIVLVPGEVTVI